MNCQPDGELLVEAMVLGTADAAQWAAGRAHLSTCADCRKSYDAAAAAVAALEGRPGGLTSGARAHLRDSLLGAVGARAPAAPRPPSRVRPWAAGAGVALAAAAAVVLAVGRGPTAPPVSAPVPRGAAGDVDGFRLFCISAAGTAPSIRTTAPSGGPPARCARADWIQFTVSTAQAGRHLRLFALPLADGAVGADDRVIWYWPRDDAAALPQGIDRPLPGSFELRIRHGVGAWRIFGVLADAPLTAEQALAAARGGPTDAEVHALTLVLE